MPTLDIFNQDAFGVISLTDAINKLKYVPGLIGQAGLFAENGVSTTAISIEERNGVLILVAPSPRGGPGKNLEKPARTARMLAIPHFQLDDAVYADEVQNVRAFGSETDTMTVARLVADRGMFATQSHEATLEYARVGAFKGIVTYSDGTSLNLFTEFGVSQENEVDFDLDNASPVGGVLRKACATVIRKIADNAEGMPIPGIYAICGNTFFDQLIQHNEVRASFLNQVAASELRTSYINTSITQATMSYGRFEFGGIIWENYRGSVGSQAFVEDTKCHIVPTSPGLFRTVFAPADYIETVNTMGQRLYMKQYPMPNDKGVHVETQMNGLCYCTRPKVLIKGKNT